MGKESVKCTTCKKLIHKPCSDAHCSFSLVVDGFMCKSRDATTQEADLAEDLVVEGEPYSCVKSFLTGRHS